MSDFLVDLGANPNARKAIKKLGLPIPLPQKLERSKEPWQERPLQDRTVIACHTSGTQFANLTARTLTSAGANPFVVGSEAGFALYEELGDAWGRPPSRLAVGEAPKAGKARGLVFDASGMKGPKDLKGLHSFFHPLMRKLAPNSRAVILSRPPDDATGPARAACAQAVDGFVRSLAREIGGKGSTAQVLYVEAGAEEQAEPVLRFLLSCRSAYISAQPIHVTGTAVTEWEAPAIRPLDGKVALVTGAAMGIGAAIAKALAREGAQVIGMDRPDEDGPLSKGMAAIGAEPLLCDITGDDAPGVIRDFMKNKYGGLDIVIHNAGVTRDKMLANMDDARWDMTLGVNLVSLIRVNQELLKILRPGGRVICMASIAGIAGNMGQTNYAASKAGVIGYVRALAPKVAGKGITVNAIAPGFIETRMTARIPLGTREVARRLCNLGQGGLPEDIGELAAFLSSPGSGGITGEVVRICGGSYVGA